MINPYIDTNWSHMPKKNISSVSFVVLSWNTLEDTRRCISNLVNLNYKNKEIVVIDNGSSDGSKEFLSKSADIIYIDLPKNTGFTGGQIEAFKHCGGDYIALINSDVVVADDWLQKCLEAFCTDKKIAAVGGRAYVWAENEKAFKTDSPFYSYQVVDGAGGYAETMMAGSKMLTVDSMSGAAVLIKKSAINKVGYFDNDFFAYYEETDLFARMQRAGYKIVYAPDAHVWHKMGKSSKSKPYFYFYQMHKNRFIFAYKNLDSPKIKKFVVNYFLHAAKSGIKYTLNRGNLDNKASFAAAWWNLSHLAITSKKRKNIQKIGASFNKYLDKHKPGDDITIVIPCYNYAEYLKEAVQSAINQTLKPARIIIIDDGSTDDSLGVATKYKNKFVDVITKANEGVIATKNLGIKLSETTWTIFLDADDVMPKNYLESLYKNACDCRSDIVYTDMNYIGAKNEKLKSQRFSLGALLINNYIHNSALISTTVLKKSGGYKKEMSGGYEDWELYITLAENGSKFSYIPEPAFLYRQHEGALGRNLDAEPKAMELRKVVKKLHSATYRRHKDPLRKFYIAVKQIVRNPFVIVVLVLALPVAFAKAIKLFFITLIRTPIHCARYYLHKKIN